MSLLLFFDLPYPASGIKTVSSDILTYPVNCVMEILKRDIGPGATKLTPAMFKSIFNEK